MSGASLHALDAGAAGALLSRTAALDFHVRENRAQPDPGSELRGHNLAVASDPAKTGPGGSGLMREFADQLFRIGPCRRSQPERPGPCPSMPVRAPLLSH